MSTAADLVREAREAEPIGAECQECEQALAMPRTHGLYRPTCTLCSMRLVARAPEAFSAMTANSRRSIEALCARALPNIQPEAAMRGVVAWWRLDHPPAP